MPCGKPRRLTRFPSCWTHRRRRPRRCSRASSRRPTATPSQRATEASYLDLSAPTDARPFFFNQLRLDRLFDQDLFAVASQARRLWRQPERDPDAGHADPHLGGSRRGDDHHSASVHRERSAVNADHRWNSLLRADRHRLHDGRNRPAPAHQRLPGPSGLCSQRRPLQPDPVNRHRQPGIRAHPARQQPPADWLVGAHQRVSLRSAFVASRGPAPSRERKPAVPGRLGRSGSRSGRLPHGFRFSRPECGWSR